MSEHTQSADGQEFTADRAVENTPFVRANLAGRTAEIRADIFNGILPLPVPETGTSWAIYHFDDGEQIESDVLAQIDRRREVLIMATADGRVRPTDPGQIRLVTREFERSSELPAYLVSDITIFRNGRALYFFDAVSYLTPGAVQYTLVPFFDISDQGALEFCTNFDSAPMVSVPFSREEKHRLVYPFGKQDSITDRAYALDRARQIVDVIKLAEPLAFGYTPD